MFSFGIRHILFLSGNSHRNLLTLRRGRISDASTTLQVIKVDHEAHGVDAPEDVDRIEAFMRERNLC